MPDFVVSNTLGLNIRSAPVVKPSTRIATLPFGQRVTKLADADVPKWWRVRTRLAGMQVEGFVNSSFLAVSSDVEAPPALGGIAEVHLTTDRPVRRDGTNRVFPLNEAGRPTRDPAGSSAEKAEALGRIVAWLNVETSLRYRPSSVTFCNIYAYDYATLAGVYLPRVWWNDTALVDLARGESVTPIYDRTVHEMSANALFRWFRDASPTFGWRRETSLTALQNAANAGGVVIITAEHRLANHSGHICAVVPETSTKKAVRSDAGEVRQPLQSQAGRTNHAYKAWVWWTMASLKDFAFYVHD